MYRHLLKKVILSVFVVVTGSGYVNASGPAQADKYYAQFRDAFDYIRARYLLEPDPQAMVNAAVNGILSSFDPYSAFYFGEEYDDFIDGTKGEFGGIGVQCIFRTGALEVIAPIDGLPAYKVGIRSGDRIIAVNGQLVSDLGFSKAMREVRGQPGTKLSLLFIKRGETEAKEVEIVRQIVEIKSVKYEIDSSDLGVVAYIRISVFNKQTAIKFKEAMREVQNKAKEESKRVVGIVLDLRSNPGGVLDPASAIAEYFLDKGVIVRVKGRNAQDETVVTASSFSEKAPKVPVVAMIDGGSASASEVLVGALQDHKRAIVVGSTSFGKGLIQSVLPMHGGAIKLTTEEYRTPSGRSINAKGIEPDIHVEDIKMAPPPVEKKRLEEQIIESAAKNYLKKYNKPVDDKDRSAKSQGLRQESKSSDSQEGEKESKAGVDDKPSMSERYRNDRQYATAYDIIRGIILHNRDVGNAPNSVLTK